jgi:NAD(P)-dependent dehydrogenase (short-subunit alcohol dehydrogenase family)
MTMPTSGPPRRWASPTKGGLNAVTKALAIESSGRGIRYNTATLGVTPLVVGEMLPADGGQSAGR